MNVHENAYSLIELLIVMSIIAIMSGASLFAYNSFNAEKLVTTESKKILNILEIARSKAINNDLGTTTSASCQPFGGYQVVFDKVAQKYKTQILCNGTAFDRITTDMSTLVDISVFPGPPAVMTFAPATGDVTTCTGSACTIHINSQSFGKCKVITLQTIGPIDEADCPPPTP